MAQAKESGDGVTVSVKLSRYHRELLVGCATRRGLSTSDYLRQLLVPVIEQDGIPPGEHPESSILGAPDSAFDAFRELAASTQREIAEARREARCWFRTLLSSSLLLQNGCDEEEARQRIEEAEAGILGAMPEE